MNIELNFNLHNREPHNHGNADNTELVGDSYTQKVNRLWQIGERIKELGMQQRNAEHAQKANSKLSGVKAKKDDETYTAIIEDIMNEREKLENEQKNLLVGKKLH